MARGGRERLSDQEIDAALQRLHWEREGDAITRNVKLEGFREALAFVNAVGELAEERDHHPDIDIRWNLVRLHLWTHSADGITPMDIELAEAIDTLEDAGG
jgi:4a-hydroxytetrahydrobiopterin dehydratase